VSAQVQQEGSGGSVTGDPVACDFIHGVAPRLTQRAERFQRPGVNGYGAIVLGYGNGQFGYRAVKFASKADVLSWIDSLEDLVGSCVTITDDFECETAHCLLERVTVEGVATARGADPENGDVDTRGSVILSGVVTA